MLTILEVSNFDRDQARDDLLVEVGGPSLRWVLVRPDRLRWTEARGRELLIEHVPAPRVGGFGDGLGARIGPGRRVVATPVILRELVQLHRPDLIVCGSPVLLPALAQLVSGRLSPRPALIGAVASPREDLGPRLRRGLEGLGAPVRVAALGAKLVGAWSTFAYASLDAVFVGHPDLAEELRRRGLDRLYLVPREAERLRDCVAREIVGYREVIEIVRSGRRVPAGIHEREPYPASIHLDAGTEPEGS